jgi:hypothetical protein
MVKSGDLRDQALLRIFVIGLQIRRTGIINTLHQLHSGTVVSGPFAGMTLPREACDLPSKLLGCYEAELHAAIVKAVGRDPAVVINIGCGQGYYAVGLAIMLPAARVFAFDAELMSQNICQSTAVANQVSPRVIVGGKCEIPSLRELLTKPTRCLLVVDCEGAELELLDPEYAPELLHCDMIIECHDFVNPLITATLRERFSASHEVENVVEGPRDPNQFEALRSWQSIDRWISVDEGRKKTNWLLCWVR